jgi:hypothetical protein
VTQHAKFVSRVRSRATGEGYVACTGSGVHAQVLFLSFCFRFFLSFLYFFLLSFLVSPFRVILPSPFYFIFLRFFLSSSLLHVRNLFLYLRLLFFFGLFLLSLCLFTLFLPSLSLFNSSLLPYMFFFLPTFAHSFLIFLFLSSLSCSLIVSFVFLFFYCFSFFSFLSPPLVLITPFSDITRTTYTVWCPNIEWCLNTILSLVFSFSLFVADTPRFCIMQVTFLHNRLTSY